MSPRKQAPADPYDPEPEVAEVDLLIERADLGPGAATLVAAGDVVPSELAGLPRRPRAGAPVARQKAAPARARRGTAPMVA